MKRNIRNLVYLILITLIIFACKKESEPSILHNTITWERITSLDFASCIANSGSNILLPGVYLSTDNGGSWSHSPVNFDISTIAIRGNTIFAGTYHNGVYMSTDNGNSWIPKKFGLPHYDFPSPPNEPEYFPVRSLVISGNNILAGDDRGMYLSTDNGSNWIHDTIGLPSYYLPHYSIKYWNGISSIASSGEYCIALASNQLSRGGGVYLSKNHGNSWSPANIGLPQPSDSGRWSLVTTLVISGNNYFAGTSGSGLYVSTDHGNSWSYTGLDSNYINALATKGDTILAGTNNGLYLSTNNGHNWLSVKGLSPGTIVNSVALNNTYAYIGTECTYYYYTTEGVKRSYLGGDGIYRQPFVKLEVLKK